ARRCLAAAREGRLGPYPPLQQRYERLADWLSDGALRRGIAPHPADLRVAVLEHRQPSHHSRNLGDYLQSLAALGLLVRHRGLEFVGDAGLTELARHFAATVK